MLSIVQLSARFGAKILFENVSVQFNWSCRYGLVGANGSGKSTLIKILTGELLPEGGHIALPPHARLGSLSQDHYRFERERTIEVVLMGRKALWSALEAKKNLLEREGATLQDGERLAGFETLIEREDGYAAEAEASKLLEGLGIRREWHEQPLQRLSGGYKLRVLLAQTLFGRPDILVLDEPTNHLDLSAIRWLEGYLGNFPGMLVVTSHDREFLNRVCTHIADVDYGTIKIYPGNYDAFCLRKQAEREQKVQLLEKGAQRRAELQGWIDRFGAKATKARQAQSRENWIARLEKELEALDLRPSSRLSPHIRFSLQRASGPVALKVQEIKKSYGNTQVLDGVSFEIERGEKVAVLGANGVGKSTLLEILTAHQPADQGSFSWGFGVHWAYFPQDHGRELRGSLSLLEWLGRCDPSTSQEQLRDLLGRVLFSGDAVHQSISTLSGGEAARLLLAKIMLQKPNVLIFDEPTNHLDMEAIEQLLEALQHFEGTLLFVSHNRYFVSSLADRILEISPLGVQNFKGTYPEYLEKQASEDYLQRPLSNASPARAKPLPSSNGYKDQKRFRNHKANLRKKMEQAEQACHLLEGSLRALEARMAAEGFYQNSSKEERQQILREKAQLEEQLSDALKCWEVAGLEFQDTQA